MKILALDTAAAICAAAVYDAGSGRVLGRAGETIGKGHAEVLMDFVVRALQEAGLTLADIDRVAVDIGPGSFTGVRIGVSAARGFALALGKPAVGVTAFEAIAAETDGPALVLLDAHRGEIYAQNFTAEGASAPMVLSRAEAEALAAAQPPETVLAGSAAAAINAALSGKFRLGGGDATGDIATYARLAALRAPGEAPKPLYMRGPDAKPQTGFALPRRAAGD